MILLEGIELEPFERDELLDLRALAGELAAEVWISAVASGERVGAIPPTVSRFEDLISVILALEPDSTGADAVALRALKDHDNPDLSALHVALDPHTLLLIRS